MLGVLAYLRGFFHIKPNWRSEERGAGRLLNIGTRGMQVIAYCGDSTLANFGISIMNIILNRREKEVAFEFPRYSRLSGNQQAVDS